MKAVLCLFVIITFVQNSRADVFKSDSPELTSNFSDPYKFQREEVLFNASRQVDLDKSIQHQIKRPFEGQDIRPLFVEIEKSPLMLLQYSAPATADLFKHFQTMAQMKLAMMYGDLRQMENNTYGDLDYFRDVSEINCVQEKLKNNSFEGDLVAMMKSCSKLSRDSNRVFAHLKYSGHPNINVFERIINTLNVRGERKNNILEILPTLKIEANAYQLTGPSKRIGHILSEKRKESKLILDDVLSNYKSEKSVTSQKLELLSLPGVVFNEQSVMDVLMLDDKERLRISNSLVEQLAVVHTLDQYDEAIEWLDRALGHLSFDQAYKNIITKGMRFLNEEKLSLVSKRAQVNDYHIVVEGLLEISQKERLNTIQQQNESKTRQQVRNNILWYKQGI